MAVRPVTIYELGLFFFFFINGIPISQPLLWEIAIVKLLLDILEIHSCIEEKVSLHTFII